MSEGTMERKGRMKKRIGIRRSHIEPCAAIATEEWVTETWIWPQQTGEKERELVWEGHAKEKKTTTGGKMGNERANETNWKSKDPTKNSHHIPKLLTLQGLPHMNAHPRHMWVHRDNLIDYGRILQHRRHLLEELRRVHHRLHLQCASG